MKLLEHGKFYNDFVDISCNKCNCKYRIQKEDIKKYDKPVKVWVGWIDDCWKEKRWYYSTCPECEHDNPIEPRDYEILTTDVKRK